MHITLHVSDLARSAAFYEEIAGLKKVRRNGARVVFLADEASGTELELIASPDEVSDNSDVAIGIYCEKVGSCHQRLRAKGMDVSNVIAPSPETHFFFVKDPDGYNIQFID